MIITVKVKQAGRRRALLENRRIEVEDLGRTPSLEDLLRAIVRRQAEEFNAKPFEKNLLPFLSKDEIRNQAPRGKVGFGSVYNERKVEPEEAQSTALRAFEDGLFSVFAGDVEIRNLKDRVALDDATVLTFIRLTFLAGGYW
ncbi:MAG TPA: hypothetical protein VIL74_18795 [Pyrinomonadaceae bacterium]|jgi:hypothetical protein